MTDPEMPIDPDDAEGRFLERALLALDGLLGAEEEAALQAELAADPERRRLFVGLCLQSQAISEGFGPQRLVAAPGDRADPGAPGLRLVDEGPGPSGRASRPARRPWLPWTIAAAACLLLVLTNG